MKDKLEKERWYVFTDADGDVVIEKSFHEHEATKAQDYVDHLKNNKNTQCYVERGEKLARKYPNKFIAEALDLIKGKWYQFERVKNRVSPVAGPYESKDEAEEALDQFVTWKDVRFVRKWDGNALVREDETRSILDRLSETVDLNRLKNLGYDDVKNAFFANYLAAMIFLKVQDIKGLMLINDPSHAKLKSFSGSMSDLNFWGRALFYPEDKQVKNRLQRGHAEILARDAGRVMDSRIIWMMKVPTTAPHVINWGEVISSLLLLKHRFELQSSYFNKIGYALHRWDAISETQRKKAIGDCFIYLMQSDPRSALLARVRELNTGSMLSKVIADVSSRFVGFKKLAEDDGGGESTGAGNVATGSQNAIIGGSSDPITRPGNEVSGDNANKLDSLYKLIKTSSTQVTRRGKRIFRGNKVVKKRVKKFKAIKFKVPKFMKVDRQEKRDA